MPSLTIDNLPGNPQRIALINPTKFLGNLLIAGGLIQQFIAWCRARDIELLIVLDERFHELFAPAFTGARLICYPRRQLQRGRPLHSARAYLRCVREIRRLRADLAFTIEEDSVSHRLAHLSGARFRISSTPARHHFGFHAVLPLKRVERPERERHIWYSFRDVFAALGMRDPRPGYIDLPQSEISDQWRHRMEETGLDPGRSIVVVHPGATKAYKQWPVHHFTELARELQRAGRQVALIGAGEPDRRINRAITAEFEGEGAGPVDLCDHLSLSDLADLLSRAEAMVGNDSGPFHLASALNVPGVVIFGPTEIDIWRPLSDSATVLENKAACDPACHRRNCLRDYACLKQITPERVLQALFSCGSGPARDNPW